MALGCDTAAAITTARVTTLQNNNITFAGRYLNYLQNQHDDLTSAEVTRLSNANIYIVSLYQASGTTGVAHFTQANGTADGNNAVTLASALGQPTGTPIYFAVDFDVSQAQIDSNVGPYFTKVIAALGSSYKIGVYGSRLICKYVRGTYAATDRYTWIVDNNWGFNTPFTAWNLRQYGWNTDIGSGTGKITIDYDESAAVGGGGWKL